MSWPERRLTPTVGIGLGLLVVLIAACAPTQPPPAAPVTSAPASAPPAAASPSGAAASGSAPAVAASPVAAQPARAPAPAAGKPGGTLVIGWEADPNVLVPAGIALGSNYRAVRLIYEALVGQDLSKSASEAPAPPLIPRLAERWDISPDGLTYTFHLRQGVRFHDGTPFTSAAVKVSYDRSTDENSEFFDATARTINAPVYRWVKSLETPDPFTVRYTLTEPFASFLLNMAGVPTGIISPEALKKWGKDGIADHPTGTGPFKFVESERGVKVVLERNAEYWGTVPLLDRVVLQPIIEPSARVAALQKGDIDVALVLPPDSVEPLQSSGQFDVLFGGPPHVWTWMLNTRATPTKDKRVRQALSYAINREALAKEILKGTAQVARGFYGPGNPAYNPATKGYTYDPAKAKQLLAEAGYPNGFDMKVFFAVSGSGMMVPLPMNEFIQNNLKQIGVNVTYETLEFAAMVAKARLGLDDETSAVQTSWGADDPYFMEQMFSANYWPPKGNNRSWYQNDSVERLMAQARGEVDDAKRMQLYHQAEELLIEDAPWIFVVNDRAPIGVSKKVKGFVWPASWFFDLNTVSLD